MQRLPCTHSGTYADDCLCDRVRQHKCYMVATCDRDLRRRIRKVPLMFLSTGLCIMHQAMLSVMCVTIGMLMQHCWQSSGAAVPLFLWLQIMQNVSYLIPGLLH